MYLSPPTNLELELMLHSECIFDYKCDECEYDCDLTEEVII